MEFQLNLGDPSKNQIKKKKVKKNKEEREFEALMEQFEKAVEKKKKLLGVKNGEKKPTQKKPQIHLEEIYKSTGPKRKTKKKRDSEKLSEYSRLTGTKPVKQKSILRRKTVKIESPPAVKRRKTGLAFLMDGLEGYEKLGNEEERTVEARPAKKVKFLDTKSDKKVEIEEFEPMFNYENTALVHEKPKVKETKVGANLKKGKGKKVEKMKRTKLKPKNGRNRKMPKKRETRKRENKPKPKKKERKPAQKPKSTIKPKTSTINKSKPALKAKPQKPVQNKTSIKSESSTSEIEFRYDSDSETTSIESEITLKTVGNFYNVSSELTNRKKIINAFKKKNNLGKKSFFKTMDFDSRKEKVSRKDVVKNKQRVNNLHNKKQKEPKQKTFNLGTGESNKNIQTISKNVRNSKTSLAKSANQFPLKSLQRSLVNFNKSEPVERNKTPKKASVQPWKTSIRDRVKKLKQSIEAKAFIIHESSSNLILMSHNANEVREMASLTKIMTCYTVLKFCARHQISMREEYFEVTPKAAAMNGTSAKLTGNTFVSIEDLLRGLMLPSGNDASMCIAENIGRLLRLRNGDLGNTQIYSGYDSVEPDFLRFVGLMNENARVLGLENSHFRNPHGLNDVDNVSTCEDLLRLSLEAMKMAKFREVVKTVEYTGRFMKKKTRRLLRSATVNEGIRSLDERQLDMHRNASNFSKTKRSISGGKQPSF